MGEIVELVMNRVQPTLFKLKIQESIDLPRLRSSYRHGQPRVRPRIWKWECPTRKAGRLEGSHSNSKYLPHMIV